MPFIWNLFTSRPSLQWLSVVSSPPSRFLDEKNSERNDQCSPPCVLSLLVVGRVAGKWFNLKFFQRRQRRTGRRDWIFTGFQLGGDGMRPRLVTWFIFFRPPPPASCLFDKIVLAFCSLVFLAALTTQLLPFGWRCVDTEITIPALFYLKTRNRPQDENECHWREKRKFVFNPKKKIITTAGRRKSRRNPTSFCILKQKKNLVSDLQKIG